MNTAALKRAKRDLRRRVLAARDALTDDERAAASVAVARRVLDLPEIKAATTVMVFSSFGSELSTEPLIDGLAARPVRVALPRIADGDLEARSYEPGDPMTVTWFGAREPDGGERIDPRDLDVVVTPAVAFDRRGGRVGYGGGFYDRFLTTVRPDAVRIGVATGVQLLEEDVPAGSFDLRVHLIVTPDEVIRCAP